MKRSSAWLVIVPVVVATVVAGVLTLLSTPRYRATADVFAGADAGAGGLLVASGSGLRAEVDAIVGDDTELSVGAAGDVLQFTASSTNADNAATAANVYADAYVELAPAAEVVERAVPPSDPYEPNVVRSVLLAALAGLAIGVVAALVVARRDTTIRSARRLTEITRAPNLAAIPSRQLDEVGPDVVVILRDPDSIESEAYRGLWTELDGVVRDHPLGVLAVTSPRTGEGKSAVAANLAAAVAQSGRKVVLVDADLRSPQVHRLFGIGNDQGLSSVLLGQAPLQPCVQRLDRERNVALLPAGPVPPDPTRLLSSARLRLAIESLAAASDLVVIDAPPVRPTADPINLAQVADATLLVATAGVTDQLEWTETVGRLRMVGADVIGTVLLRPGAGVRDAPGRRDEPMPPRVTEG